MGRTFCRAEVAPFDSKAFAPWSNGVVIHVITDTDGHTTDGIPAHYRATRDNAGTWTVEDVVLDISSIDVAAEE